MFKKALIVASCTIVASFAFSFTHYAHAEASAGFIDTAIWFSNEPDTVDETVTISTLINNQDAKAIYGVVGFYDNNKLIGSKASTIDARASKVVAISWKVTAGSHSLVAKFENTRYSSEKGTATTVANSDTDPVRFSVMTAEEKKAQSTNKTSTKTGTGTTETEIKKTADDVKVAAEGAFGKFDAFRNSTAESLETKTSDAEKDLTQAKSIPKEKQTALQTPFAYLKVLFYKAAHFIFGNIYVFYGLIFLIIILFVRYLIRAPR